MCIWCHAHYSRHRHDTRPQRPRAIVRLVKQAQERSSRFRPGYTAGEELDRALRLLERGREPAGVLEELSRRLMNKLLHAPTKALLEEL